MELILRNLKVYFYCLFSRAEIIVKDFGRLITFLIVFAAVTIYVYYNHWDQFYPLFGYGILFIVFIIVLIGLGTLFAYLAEANKNNNFQVIKFSKTMFFTLSCFAVAAPIFWFSEPLIYKSISATVGERVMPDWYFEFFQREKPDFEPVKLEKFDLF